MKKRLLTILFSVLAVAVLAFAVTACSNPLAQPPKAPENIQYDGSTLTWDAVQNAGGYVVKINDGNEINLTANRYGYNASNRAFTVSIKTLSQDKSQSSTETVQNFQPLSQIDRLAVNNDALTWDTVESATAYLVRIDNSTDPIKVYDTSFNEFTEGRHTYYVRPIVDGDSSYYSKWSTAKSITLLGKVDASQIKYELGFLTWGNAGATSYEVVINGIPQDNPVAGTSYQYDANRFDFDVAIRALGNGTDILNGKLSDTKSFVFLDPVTNIQVEDGILTWDAVNGADEYELKINNVVQRTHITETKYDRLIENVATDFQVRAISRDTTYFSDWSDTKSVLILPPPVLQWNDSLDLDGEAKNSLFWDAVNGAQSYSVKVTDPNGNVSEPATVTGVNFAYAYLMTGTYKVQVKSNADTSSGTVYDSKYSQEITVIRLAKPVAASNNFITSNPNNPAAGFTVTVNRPTYSDCFNVWKDGTKTDTKSETQMVISDFYDRNITDEQTFNYIIQSAKRTPVSKQGGKTVVTLNSLSNDSLSFKIKMLATPQDVSMDGFTLSYGSISGSSGYCIDVSSTQFTSLTTNYNLENLNTGNYNVRVCARGNASDVIASNFTAAFTLKRLPAPTGIRIGVADAEEGTLTFQPVEFAQSYNIVLNNDDVQIPSGEIGNMNRRISEQGTSVYMISVANYYNVDETVYYMTSQKSYTMNFVKLAAPTFGSPAFTNTQLMWNAPNNMNASIYTPTYQVYDEDHYLYNGEKNGTTMNIKYLEGGRDYSFTVKAVGDGENYINSEESDAVNIYKLATPVINRGAAGTGNYNFNGVINATNYTAYIDGNLVATIVHDGVKKYEFTPTFDKIKTYQVVVVAVGDGGYTTINSDDAVLEQVVRQLDTPNFTFGYTEACFNVTTGKIFIEISEPSQYCQGYVYDFGGADLQTTSETRYEYNVGAPGEFKLAVFAQGRVFGGTDGTTYYIDSQTQGGNDEYKLTILPSPNVSEINVNRDGVLTWPTIKGASGYSVFIKTSASGDWGEVINCNTASYVIENWAEIKDGYVRVKIQAKGNGANIISSDWSEKQIHP